MNTFLISPFRRKDALAGLFSGLVALLVFAWTAAPNVTLLDSGEFIAAAEHFGVPHPTGYPLWTFLNWLFTLLPLGNAAWEINLFSGICGAFAVALGTMLMCNALDWLFEKEEKDTTTETLHFISTLPPLLAPLLASVGCLMAAFSEPFWTQAVIAEVYCLHILITVALLVAIYRWIREPEQMRHLLPIVFIYALGWTNHHLMVVFAPLLVLLVLLLCKRDIVEWILYFALAGASVYLGFAYLSNDPTTEIVDDPGTWHSAIRFFFCVILAFALYVWKKKKLHHWKIGFSFLPVIFIGLLPYLYMPYASSTNPPMNWAYTSKQIGFFRSINRSQYQGPLSDQLLKTVGRITGEALPEKFNPNVPYEGPSKIQLARLFCGFYWTKVQESMGWIPILLFLPTFLSLLMLDFPRRMWVLTLFLSFLLTAFLQPSIDHPGISASSWVLQMPYHGYSFFILGMITTIGLTLVSTLFIQHTRLSWKWMFLWLVLPLSVWNTNVDSCSQHNHWFGWQYGHDMLKDLPKDSILFGGTDPGRFVPTYMIFGESTQPAKNKRDPDFDRRDIYIITQNALSDPAYINYIRDHYAETRPHAKNNWERWLLRDRLYPKEPIFIPTADEVQELSKKFAAELTSGNADLVTELHGKIARDIFEKNKEKHTFFIEESFPMKWSYDYAVPHGLVYQLSSEPLQKIPKAAIDQDFAFWNEYITRLLSDPRFQNDLDAQRSFSKLRTTMGNIYRYRGLEKEAELAYRQSIALMPANAESVGPFCELMTSQKRFEPALQVVEKALLDDPYNGYFLQLRERVAIKKEASDNISNLLANLEKTPEDTATLMQVLSNYVTLGEDNAADRLMAQTLKKAKNPLPLYPIFFEFYLTQSKWKEALTIGKGWEKSAPKDVQLKMNITRLYFNLGMRNEFYRYAKEAIALGGIPAREFFELDPSFQPIREEKEFQALVKTNQK